jgi:hypothetical protein
VLLLPSLIRERKGYGGKEILSRLVARIQQKSTHTHALKSACPAIMSHGTPSAALPQDPNALIEVILPSPSPLPMH